VLWDCFPERVQAKAREWWQISGGHFVYFSVQNACGGFADIFVRAVGNTV